MDYGREIIKSSHKDDANAVKEWLCRVTAIHPPAGRASLAEVVLKEIKALDKAAKGKQLAIDLLNGARRAGKVLASLAKGRGSWDEATSSSDSDDEQIHQDEFQLDILVGKDQIQQLYLLLIHRVFVHLGQCRVTMTSQPGSSPLSSTPEGASAEMGTAAMRLKEFLRNETMQAALLACVLEVVVMAHAPGWEEGEVIGKDIAFPSPSLQLIGMAGMLDLWEACNWAYILLEPEMWGCIGHSEAAEGLKGSSIIPPPGTVQRFISYMKVSVEEVLAWQPGSGLFHAMVHGGGGSVPSGDRGNVSDFLSSVFELAAQRTHHVVIELARRAGVAVPSEEACADFCDKCRAVLFEALQVLLEAAHVSTIVICSVFSNFQANPQLIPGLEENMATLPKIYQSLAAVSPLAAQSIAALVEAMGTTEERCGKQGEEAQGSMEVTEAEALNALLAFFTGVFEPATRHIYGAAGTPERGTAQDSKTTCRRLFGGSGEESDNLASAEETGTGKSSEMGQSAPQVMSSAPAAQEVLKIYVSTLGEATPQGLQSTAVRPKNNAGKRVHGARESTPGKDMVEGALPFSLESSFGRKSVLSSLRPAELNVRRATPQQQQRRDAEQTFRRRPGRSGTRMAAMRG